MTSEELKKEVLEKYWEILAESGLGAEDPSYCTEFEELLDKLIEAVVEETEASYGILSVEDSERLLESLNNVCSPEEVERRRKAAKEFLKKATGKDED